MTTGDDDIRAAVLKLHEVRVGAAYHEAGHVIVAYAFGLDVAGIQIDDYGGGGSSEIQNPKERSLIEQAALCLAGGAAQKQFKCLTNRNAMKEDWKTFREITEDETRAQQCGAKRAGYALACQIIVANANELKRLADFLMTHRGKRTHICEFQPPLKLLKA
jgi:hypothetical protein